MVSVSRITNRKSGQDLLSHQMARLKMGIVRISWGTGEKYATNGFDPTNAGKELGITDIKGIYVVGGSATLIKYHIRYNTDPTSAGYKKVQIFGFTTTASSSAIPFVEIDNNTSLAGEYLDLFIIGY